MVISEHNHKSLKQTVTQQQSKKIFNKPKSDPLERKMQNDKQITTDTNRPKSWPNKLEVTFFFFNTMIYNMKILYSIIFSKSKNFF